MPRLQNARLIAPISHARMGNSQSPDHVLAALFSGLAAMVEAPSNDVDLVLTTGLYMNNAGARRLALIQTAAQWRDRFAKELATARKLGQRVGAYDLTPEAFAFVEWDAHLSTHWPEFQNNLQRIRTLYDNDPAFRQLVHDDITGGRREVTPETLAFIFEETAVTALWCTDRYATTPRLAQGSAQETVIAYPGPPMRSMVYAVEQVFKNRKNLKPLVWADTSTPHHVMPSRFQLGQ